MTASRNPSSHPARFNDALIPVMAQFIGYSGRLLDPFAGTGEKLAKLFEDNHFAGEIYGNEIEPYWAGFAPPRIAMNIGDARDLPYEDEVFDYVLTSPTYANRMADSHTPTEKDKSTQGRNTYTHRHMKATGGQKLQPGNSGAMQWGADYRKLHLHAWVECWRVLKAQGHLILNIKDHIRAGKRIHVTRWHLRTLERIGFHVEDHIQVPLDGLRHGENAGTRITYESVVHLVKKAWTP
jgi:DNA modification methylase